MALVVEDGSLVSGANSYVTVEDVRAYAGARTSTVPAAGEDGDAAIEAACIVANDYLESLRAEYQGTKVDPAEQALQWPREDVVIDGWDVPEDHIPKELKAAQCQLAIEVVNGLDLMPTADGREVIKKKIDVLETTYQPGSNANPQPVLNKVHALLAPLMSSGGFGGLTVGRI